jgi:PTH1 family peptidyl-tRNA hydrolase
MKYLVVGLGNIGPEYDATRHNIGFDIADAFVIKHGGNFQLDRLAMVSHTKFKGKQVVVIKPTTYMNLSGKALKYWMDKEKIPIENVIVLVDELALPFETIRLKPAGSDGGHNGLKDIQQTLGTTKYTRLRFGIGNNFPKGMQVEFVLGKWTKQEIEIVKEKILKSVDAIESFIFAGLERTMNTFNK